MSEKNRAWIYTRVDTQDKNDITLKMHETALCQYAQQQGYTVVGASVDAASGRNLNRSGLNQMLESAQQGGIRPVLILQNNVGNLHSPTVIACAITARPGKTSLPTHVAIGRYSGLSKSSIALLEQLRTIDKARLQDKIGYITPKKTEQIDTALQISIGLAPTLSYFTEQEEQSCRKQQHLKT